MTAAPATSSPWRTKLAELKRRHANRLLWIAITAMAAWALIAHPKFFVVGVIVGSVIALGALGLTLIYGILKFAHFAHGDAMMLGAYLAFFLLSGRVMGTRGTGDYEAPLRLDLLPEASTTLGDLSFGYGLLLAIPLGGLIVAGALLVIDRFVYKPLREREAGLAIFAVASLGVAIAMRSVILMIWGPTPRSYTTGIRETVALGPDVLVVVDQIFIVTVAGLLTAGTYLLLYRTELGRAMRAMSDNPHLARISGIDTDRVVRWTWVISGLLIGVAGSLLGLQSQLKPEFGFLLLLPVFAAAILGGIGSPRGALVGGLVVGVAQEVAVQLPGISPGYKFSVAFVILILVILVVPRGLFGEAQR